MSCCERACYHAQFGAKVAAADLRRYRTKGPDKTTRLLLGFRRARPDGRTGRRRHPRPSHLLLRHMEPLVAASAARARRLYGAVFPRDIWLIRVVFALANLFRRVRGSSFRTYLHPPGAIDSVLREHGLEVRARRDTLVWRVAVYAR